MSATVTCTTCGSVLQADQSWCSLCFTRPGDPTDGRSDLGTAYDEPFDPLTAPLERLLEQAVEPAPAQAVPTARVPALDQAAATAAAPPAPVVPRATNPPAMTSEPVSETVVPRAGDQTVQEVSDIDVMLSMLAAEHRAMDPTTALSDRFEEKSTRVAIMIGGTVVVGALLFAVLMVLGAIF